MIPDQSPFGDKDPQQIFEEEMTRIAGEMVKGFETTHAVIKAYFDQLISMGFPVEAAGLMTTDIHRLTAESIAMSMRNYGR